jgi:hypothetical protein
MSRPECSRYVPTRASQLAQQTSPTRYTKIHVLPSRFGLVQRVMTDVQDAQGNPMSVHWQLTFATARLCVG